MKVIPLSIIACLLLTGVGQAQKPRTLEGEAFVGSLPAAGAQLDLKGVGLAKYLVFKVMVGGLYLPPDIPAGDVLKNVPKHFEVAYLRAAPAADLVKLANKTLDKTLSKADRERFRAKADQANRMFRDVVKGERCSVTFQPGVGTTVSYNGKPVGTVAGDDFAAAYFTIWFGERCCSAEMRKAIFAGR